MGMLGSQEIILIFGAIVLLFGAAKLPELARSMGRSMGEFKRGQRDIENELTGNTGIINASASSDLALTRVQRMANSMGIETSGKTDEQLLAEIEKRVGK